MGYPDRIVAPLGTGSKGALDDTKRATKSGRLVEQPLRVLQIRRVKALGKPVVHRRQPVVVVLALVLGLPEPTEVCYNPVMPSD